MVRSPSEDLKALCGESWQAVANHAFCEELSAGSLSIDKMKTYLIQDYTFLDSFVRLAASAIAHAPTLDDSIPLAQFLAVVTGPENTYFQRSFEALSVTEDQWRSPTLWKATCGFQAIMSEAVQSGSYARMMAVLVVAEWTYLSWATRYHPAPDSLPFYYAEWIELHAGPGFEALVRYLRHQLDVLWPSLAHEERTAVESLFRRAVDLEQEFFDTAYAEAK